MEESMLKRAEKHMAVLEGMRKEERQQTARVQQKQELVESLESNEKLTEDGYEYLNALVRSESDRFVSELSDILNYGMKVIFDDEDYTVKIQTDSGRSSVWLDYDHDGQHIHTDIKSCGGGIRTVIGFLMQVYFIFQYDAAKIIVVDEGFSQVSSQYMPNLFALIHELCEGNGLKVLLVTHDQRVMEYADRHYEITDGKAVEV